VHRFLHVLKSVSVVLLMCQFKDESLEKGYITLNEHLPLLKQRTLKHLCTCHLSLAFSVDKRLFSIHMEHIVRKNRIGFGILDLI